MTNDRPGIELTRRKLLAGLGSVGLASAGAGMGTTALFNDEESFQSNSIQAGELDLEVEYELAATNAYWEDQALSFGPATLDGGTGVNLSLSDVKPGDWFIIELTPRITGNPGYLRLTGDLTADRENGQNEAERPDGDGESGDTTPNDGELAEALETTLWAGFDDSGADPGPADLTDALPQFDGDGDGTPDVVEAPPSLREAMAILNAGLTVRADGPNGRTLPAGEAICLGTGGEPASRTYYLLVRLPAGTGNEVQSDGAAFDLAFQTEQCRNNPTPFCQRPLSTGVADWSLTGTPGSVSGTAQVTDPHPDWATSTCASWINPFGTYTGPDPAGDYVYELPFSAPGTCTVAIEAYAADNELTLDLDGTTIAELSDGRTPFTTLHGPVMTTVGPGNHTLEATVYNRSGSGGMNPTGLLLCGALDCGRVVLSTGRTDWTLVDAPSGVSGSAQVTDPHPLWTTSTCADWINPFGTYESPPDPEGTYAYEADFELAGDQTDCELRIREYAADNEVTFYLDGTELGGSGGANAFGSLGGPLSTAVGPGPHTLRAEVYNRPRQGTGINPTGFLACVEVSCPC